MMTYEALLVLQAPAGFHFCSVSTYRRLFVTKRETEC